MKPAPSAIVLTVAALIGWYGVKHPQHSWDTVPYVALVLSLDGVPDADLQRETYARLGAELPADYYTSLASGSPGRQEVASSPSVFAALLPMWAIKPLYIWATWGILKSGVGVVQATTIVSTMSAMVLYVLLNVWMFRHFSNFAGLVLAIAVATSGGLDHFLGLARPDGLSALLMFSSVFALTEYQATRLAGLLGVVAVLARPDNVVMASMMGLYIAIATPGASVRQDRLAGTLSLIVAILTYVIVQRVAGAPGWAATVAFSFTPPASMALLHASAITPSGYLEVLYRALRRGVPTLAFMRFAAFSAVALITAYNSMKRSPLRTHILVMLVLANVIHWLAFPSFFPRFFVGSYMAIACIALSALKNTGWMPETMHTNSRA